MSIKSTFAVYIAVHSSSEGRGVEAHPETSISRLYREGDNASHYIFDTLYEDIRHLTETTGGYQRVTVMITGCGISRTSNLDVSWKVDYATGAVSCILT